MKHRQISQKPSKKFFGYILLSVAIYASAVVAYRLVWTNYVSEKETEVKIISIREDWNTPGAESSLDLTKGFALLYIPRLRNSVWELPISQGVDSAQLDTGSGHYPLSAKPGESGNLALAGHRSGHGEPFANFELLQTGDRVVVETKEKWFVYELALDAEVKPEELWVIDSNPGGLANKVGTDKLLTLVTCTPRYGSTGRWVWWGYLVEELPKKQIPSDVKAS
jgi:sortase A